MERFKDTHSCYREGFTIVETMLAFAIAGMLFVGAIIGVGTNLSRQRFKDTTTQAVDLIRKQYELAMRVHIQERPNDDLCTLIIGGAPGSERKNTNRGRTDCNIYGTAFYIGADNGTRVQSTTLIGQDLSSYIQDLVENGIPDKSGGSNKKTNYAGANEYIMGLTDIELLGKLGIGNYYAKDNSPTAACTVANMNSDNPLRWGGIFQDPGNLVKEKHKNIDFAKKNNLYTKMVVVIARSPRDGAIHTYVYDLNEDNSLAPYDKKNKSTGVKVPNLKTIAKDCTVDKFGPINIKKLIEKGKLVSREVNICLNSEDARADNARLRNIRIKKDGASSSAVVLRDADPDSDAEDICNPVEAAP